MRKFTAFLLILAGVSVYLACQEKTTQPPPAVNHWNIHGQVLRIESNAPIVGARITFASDSTLTDTSGYFNFDSVPEGRYLFRAALSGFPIYHDSVSLIHDLEYNVPLMGYDNLYGLVTNRNGDTVSGAAVAIGDIKDTTDDSGYYYLRSVPVGQRILGCTDSEQYPFLDTLMITIMPQRNDIILEPKYNLLGTVKDRGGAPIQGATVAVGDIQGASDDSGFYQLPLVPLGSQVIHCRADKYIEDSATLLVTPAQQRHDFHLKSLLVDTLFITEDASISTDYEHISHADSNNNGPILISWFYVAPYIEGPVVEKGGFLIKLPVLESNLPNNVDSIKLELSFYDAWSTCETPDWSLNVRILAIRNDWGESTVTWNTQPSSTGAFMPLLAYPRDLRLDVTSCYLDSVNWPGTLYFDSPMTPSCHWAGGGLFFHSSEAVDIIKRPKVIVYRTY